MPLNLEGTSENSSTQDDANIASNLDVENQDGVTPEGDQETALESSTEADAKDVVSDEPQEPIDIVKAVLKDMNGSEEDADEDQDKQQDESSKSESDSQKSEDDVPEDLGEITEEELGSYKPKTRKRIETLLDDRSRQAERIKDLEPVAEQMDSLQNFMREKNLTAQNVSEYMVLGGLALSDDIEDNRTALNKINEYKALLEQRLGEVVPDDLQKKVDDGLLDEESAREVSLSRANSQRATSIAQRAEETVETNRGEMKQKDVDAAAVVINTAISDWQRQKVATDPDFERKSPFLQDKIRAKVAEAGGRVLDREQALSIAEKAYEEVGEQVKMFSPVKAPEAKKVLSSNGGQGNMTSAPKTPLEAAQQSLANMG